MARRVPIDRGHYRQRRTKHLGPFRPANPVGVRYDVPPEYEEYEKFVRDMMEVLLHAQGLTTIKVEHDVELQGFGGKHQIDVYWEYRIGGVTHRTAVSCKHYKRAVTKGRVQELKGVLDDLPGVQGVVVTTKGFQSGAIEFATAHKIGLKIIRPPEDADWTGRIRTIETVVRLRIPRDQGISIMFDLPWAEAHLTSDERDQLLRIIVDLDAIHVDDVEAGTRTALRALVDSAFASRVGSTEDAVSVLTKWPNAYLAGEGFPRAKLATTTVTGRLSSNAEQRMILQSDATAIIRDAIDGTLLFIDPDGKVSGDTEEEGVS